jgi:hypothetical protein
MIKLAPLELAPRKGRGDLCGQIPQALTHFPHAGELV